MEELGGSGRGQPPQRAELPNATLTADEIFRIAAKYLSDDEILRSIQKWIKEDKATFLVNALERLDTSLAEIGDALGRFLTTSAVDAKDLTPVATHMGAARLAHPALLHRPAGVHQHREEAPRGGRLLTSCCSASCCHPTATASWAARAPACSSPPASWPARRPRTSCSRDIKVPKTWYIPSDGILDFIHYNNLEDVYNHKYADIEQVRQEYPHIVQVFKNSFFSPEMVRGLSLALDELGDTPIIVRSSSLLEDSMGSAFSGKYKSLFLANQGTKKERLAALMDAIAEVYASVFGPDPLEYRAERGLLDVHEEMGIMIQEVVGTRIGQYFFCRLRRAWPSATTSSAGRRASSGRTACCAWCPDWAPGPSTAWPTTTRCWSRPASPVCAST